MPQPGVALEKLGFDAAWVRHRHLRYGISSPVAVLAAASQRTSRIELGTAVTALGWENPPRLAEDLATVDIVSGGRLNPGFSVGSPRNWDEDPAFREVTEVAFALPFTCEHEDYAQILTDMATRLGPALGWAPNDQVRGG